MNLFLKSVMTITFISVVLLIVTLLQTEEKPLSIYSVRESHTYVYTSSLETFTIPILINHPNSVLVLEEQIINISIEAADQSLRVPLELHSISFKQKQLFKEDNYYQYHFHLKPSIYAEDDVIEIKEAFLIIDYTNQFQLKLNIGVFTYRFGALNDTALFVYDRINIHEQSGGLPNSFGLIFSLANKTSSTIEIIKVSIQNPQVTPNMKHIKEIDPIHSGKIDMATIFKDYDPLEPFEYHKQPMTVPAYKENHYFIPFSYKEDVDLLTHKYPLIISYLLDGERYELIADDFRFIRTNVFDSYHPRIHQRGTYGKN